MTEKECREQNKIRRRLNKQKRLRCEFCNHGSPNHGWKSCIAPINGGKCGCNVNANIKTSR